MQQFLGNIGRFNTSPEATPAIGPGWRALRQRPQSAPVAGAEAAPAGPHQPPDMAAMLARISSATMLAILIIGLIAGPAVSL